jgi:quercetin dioxygenase-like cupin family protein
MLPRADYSAHGAEGIRGYVIAGPTCQVVFNENDDEVVFRPHRHAQSFGVVLAGECELVIDGVSTTYRAGDVYHVPGGVTHYARQSAGYRDVVVFDEPARVPVAEDR